MHSDGGRDLAAFIAPKWRLEVAHTAGVPLLVGQTTATTTNGPIADGTVNGSPKAIAASTATAGGTRP